MVLQGFQEEPDSIIFLCTIILSAFRAPFFIYEKYLGKAQNGGKMTGYLMNFFKYAVIDTDDFEDSDQLYLNAHGGELFVRSVVWSVFDRIEIREIKTFEEFRLSQYSEKKWVGERQFTLLYEINPQKSHLCYKKSEDKCLFSFHKVYEDNVTEIDRKRKEEKYRFFGISMIDLAPEVHNDFYVTDQPGVTMYKVMRNIIDELCSKNEIEDDKLCFELYGTLGGNDLVIIWLANEFRDVVTILEALRMSRIKNSNKSIIANVATIMGLRDINNDNINYEKIEGQLNIRFTKKGTYNHKEFKKALSLFLGYDNVKFDTTLGEHDLSLRIPGIELTKKIYNDSGFIHIRNPKFLENIIQANTELSVKIDYDSLKKTEYKLVKTLNRTIISLDEKEEVFKDIEEIVNDKIFQGLPYLKETLWILYEDYLRNISSSFSYPWISDLHYQFGSSMKYLKELVKDDICLSKDKKFESIKELISTIRQTILHMSQANRLFFEIPNTHLKNTGSYSKILRTYYGIVKQLLTQAYCIPKHGSQNVIVPYVTFDVIPIIKSTVLPRLPKSEYIIVNIVLPYEALVDIPKYAKLLAHEVYHYIAPSQRIARNTEVGIICVTLFIAQLLISYMDEIISEVFEKERKKIILHTFVDVINEKSLKYIITKYEEFVSYVEDYNSDDEWTVFFSKLNKIFSEKSMEFPKLDELHAKICIIFNDIISISVKDIGLQKLSEKELKRFENLLQNESQEKFVCWLIEKGYKNTNGLVKEVKFALREIAPDYFMLQVMKRENRERDYYQLILYYKTLLTTDEKQMGQIFRIGIMTDYLFSDITNNLGQRDTKEVIMELKKTLGAKTSISKEGEEYVIKSFVQYYETLKQYRSIIFLYIKNMDFESFKTSEFERSLKKTRGLLDDREADDFYKSVQYVERFQVQRGLNTLSDFRKVANGKVYDIENIRKELSIEILSSISQQREGRFAWDVNSLIRNIDKAAKEVADATEPIWFRGHRSYKYKLLPSLYRMKDEKMNFYKGITPRDIMEPLFQSFKVRAFGAKEIFQGGDDSRIGILVSMQHYSVPTNILDWTPSAFTALYFAIEDYMFYNEKEKIERKTPEDDAEIWILNPIRLNKARALLISRKIDKGTMWEYPIPSIYENDEEYKAYIPFSTKKEPLNVPVAVYVPHVNQRIKAQLGTFTMFSLDSEGTETEDGQSVRFQDLIDFQEQYKGLVEEDEYKPFLVSVRVSKNCLLEVADWLRRMGVSKPNVYPELSNICKSLTGEIRDYWEKKDKNI